MNIVCESSKSEVQRISVVVISYNRPETLNETVKSLLNQSIEPFEIIVIDDGSNPPLNLKFNPKNLRLIRFDEERGLSKARNYGIFTAKGEYVAFIDDDAIASKTWLEEIEKGIKAGAEVLGGPIEPLFKAKPPEWWNEEEFGYIVGVGNQEIRSIWGANMIFKKRIFKRIGFFNPKIGRKNGKLFSGEDSNLIDKAKNNCSIMFLPKAKVFHIVKSERLTFRYILRWRYYCGKSLKKLSRHRTLHTLMIGFKIIAIAMEIVNPFALFRKKIKITKFAELSELLGALL